MMNIQQILFKCFRAIFVEILLVLVLVFSIDSYLDTPQTTITSDGIGYYEYLPSLFIHHDINREKMDTLENPSTLNRIKHLPPNIYNRIEGNYVNKYTCGTAVLQAPFFLFTYLTHQRTGTFNDGYQDYFQYSIYAATFFYLFLGLYFVKRLLREYNLSRGSIFLTQALIVFSTNIVHYSSYNASYSHVYSFCGIAFFLFVVKRYFATHRKQYIYWAIGLLGCIFILRQINILVVFTLPFLAGTWSQFKSGLQSVLSHYIALIVGTVIAFSFIFLQMLAWKLQSGNWIVYSYGHEGFNFLNPQIVNILLSFKRGLLIYTPILWLILPGLYFWFRKKEYYTLSSWLLFTAALCYVFSSWWAWEYGASFSSRPFIDFYAFLFIPIAIFIEQIRKRKWLIYAPLLGFGFTIVLNFIQTYQYNHFIFHWLDMNKTRYVQLFLKTDRRYEGLLYKQLETVESYSFLGDIDLNDTRTQPYQAGVLIDINSDDLQSLHNADICRILLESDYQESNDAQIVVEIFDTVTNSNLFWHSKYLIHFAEKEFGQRQVGVYDFILPELNTQNPLQLKLTILADKEAFWTKNGKIELYRK